MGASATASRVLILSVLFFTGAVLMGFEMLGSRYLNPYFGSGVDTWACLISIILLSMMIGYYLGGAIVDRYPNPQLFTLFSALSGASMAVIPFIARDLLEVIIVTFGDRFWGTLMGALFISFLPVLLISACSPVAVRLLLSQLDDSGKITGMVYSISTFGNVVGTLGTTYFLIPNFGIRAITFAFAVSLFVISLAIFLLSRRIARPAAPAAAILLALGGALAAGPTPLWADQPRHRHEALYPEGPIWFGDALYVAAMESDHILRIDGDEAAVFWAEPGCGPTALARFGAADLLALCHSAGKLVVLDAAGAKKAELLGPGDGTRFFNPNDVTADGAGGAFFSDPGPFSSRARAVGRVFHVAPSGAVTRLATGLFYPNGLTYDPDRRLLVLSEHLARRLHWLSYDGDRLTRIETLALSDHLRAAGVAYPEAGPDGVEFFAGGVLVALYGAGQVIHVKDGQIAAALPVTARFVTNIAASEAGVAVVGAHRNARRPLIGAIEIWDSHAFAAEMEGYGTR